MYMLSENLSEARGKLKIFTDFFFFQKRVSIGNARDSIRQKKKKKRMIPNIL